MPCYYPVQAWRTSAGDVVFAERGDIVSSLFLPCGRCVGCRLERSRQWAVRIMHESMCYERSSFVTLTYDEEHVDKQYCLKYNDFQLFLKRWRKRHGKVRYFSVGEYGGDTGRPHFHCALFGVWPADLKYWRKSETGHKLYRSKTIEDVWQQGNVEIGELTFESAAYMARYCLEKVNGDLAEEHYKRIDPSTGEVYSLPPECAHMSLKPGIGALWFDRFGYRVLDHDNVISNGHPAKPPKYYDRLMERVAPDRFEELRNKRAVRMKLQAAEGTPERLAVREEVAQARVRFKLRNKL